MPTDPNKVLRDKKVQKQAQPQQQAQQKPVRDWNKIMFRNATVNYGRFQDQPAARPIGPNRRLRPRPEQGAWESGYMEYLKGPRPAYEQNVAPDQPSLQGIDLWREQEFFSQFDKGTPGQWNGKQIKGPLGQGLPANAIGFDYNGQPYWGTGLKARMMRFYDGFSPTPDTEEFEGPIVATYEGKWMEKYGWDQTIKKYLGGEEGVGQAVLGAGIEEERERVDPFQTVANWVKWAKSPSEDTGVNFAKGLSRFGANILDAVVAVDEATAVGLEQGQGALLGLEEANIKLGRGPSATFQDAMDNLGQPGAWLKAHTPQWVTNFLNTGMKMTGGSVQATAAVATTDATFDDVWDDVEMGYKSGLILYSMVEDVGKKQEMERWIEGGADPVLVAQMLENPWMEAAGRATVNPWTYTGVGTLLKGTKLGKFTRLGRAAKAANYLEVSDEVMDVIRKAPSLHGVTDLSQAGDDLARGLKKAVEVNADEAARLKGLAGDISLRAPSQKGKITAGMEDVGEVLSYIAKNTHDNPEDVAQAVAALWKMGDDTSEMVVKAGVEEMSRLMGGASLRPVMGHAGTQASFFMRKMFPKAEDALALVEKAGGDTGELVRLMDVKLEKTFKDFFPTARKVVDTRLKAGEHVPMHVRAAVRWHEKTKPAYDLTMNVFSTVYMGYSPGFAAKNFSSNTFQQIVDQGPLNTLRGYLRPWKVGTTSNDDTAKMLGGVVPKGTAGFGGVAAGEDVGRVAEGAGILDRPTQQAADFMEKTGAQKIVNNSVKETMNLGLIEGGALPRVNDMVAAGVPEDMARSFINRAQDTFGEVDQVLDEMRKASKTTGHIDAFKNMEWLTPGRKSQLRDYDLYEDLIEIVNDSKSLDEAMSAWDDVSAQLENLVNRVKTDAPTASMDGAMTETIADYAEEIRRLGGPGIDDKIAHATWVGEANNQALDSMSEAMWHLWAATSDRDIWKVVDARTGRSYMQILRNPNMGPVWKEARDMATRAREYTARLQGATATRETMKEIWDEIPEFIGEIPSNMTNKQLRNKIWDEWFFPGSADMYRQYREFYNTTAEMVFKHLAPEDSRMFFHAKGKWNVARQWDNVQRSDQYLTKILSYQDAGDWNAMSRTLLDKFGLPSQGGLPHTMNIFNKYTKKVKDAADATVKWTADDLAKGDITWKDIDEAFIEQMAHKSGMNQDWEIVDQIQKLTNKQIDDFLASDDVVYEIAEKADNPGFYRMKAPNDAGRNVFVTAEWSDDLPKVKKEGVQNVLDDLYVGRKSQTGTGLVERQKEWRKALGIEKKAAEVVEEGEEVAEGFRLSNEWQELPADVQVPALPAIKFVEIDGKMYTKIDESVRGAKALTEELPPIPYGGEFPSIPRVYAEQFDGIKGMMDEVGEAMTQNWGKKKPVAFNREINNALQSFGKETKKRVSELRYYATRKANLDREFGLLNYGKRNNWDTVLSQFFPYHFWYNRTYTNWASRVMDRPGLAFNYYRYKDALAKENAGMPTWWQGNVDLSKIGLTKNPAFVNLEATLSPMYGLTGSNFNDPYKRINWWTRTIDDMGKYGPSTYTPLSWAVAGALYMQGEKEASARWAGRMLPQTRALKAGLSLAGVKIDTPGQGINEFDPMVHLASGGMDAYERNRVGRYAATMIEQRPQDEAAIQEALYNQQGELWNEMVQGAQRLRAPGDLAGFFAGVGFKPRSTQDMQIDMMDQEYRRMWANAGAHDGDWVKDEINRLQSVYPWMDTVLLSRKHGLARDRAYSYSVLGRMPPGLKDDFFRANNMDPDWYQKFYDSKGNLTEWKESDRKQFIQFIVDTGAVLDMPDDATKAEWGYVKDQYGQVMDEMETRFGADVHHRIGMYYDLSDDKVAQDNFLNANPDIQVALSWKDTQIKNDPQVAAYYMSVSKLERYYNSFAYDILDEEYPGVDWNATWQGYFDAKLESKEAGRAYWKDHPELARSIDIKAKAREYTDAAFVRTAKNLESPHWPNIRPEPEEGFGIRQQEMAEFVETVQEDQLPEEFNYSWSEWQGQMGPNLGNLVADYAYGEDLPEMAMDQLERMADRLDMSVNVMLELMSESALSRQY